MVSHKKVFGAKCEFILGAHNFSQVPQTNLPEIAFIGTSNAGKSSLINALVGKKIAIVSTTPGRTRQLNFFNIGDQFMLVDMPGYGYAKANSRHSDTWQRNSFEYLAKRPNLKRLFVLVDAVKGLKPADYESIQVLNSFAVYFQIVLTKIDKLNRKELEESKQKVIQEIVKWPASHAGILTVSSSKGYGITELQNEIIELLD